MGLRMYGSDDENDDDVQLKWPFGRFGLYGLFGEFEVKYHNSDNGNPIQCLKSPIIRNGKFIK